MRGLRVVAVGAVVLGTGASLFGCFAIDSLPVASFTRSPSSGQAPLEVRFDASSSADADGTIARYDWTFGDGEAASGPEWAYVYEGPGLYEAMLLVTDDRGASASCARMVDVADPNGGPRSAQRSGRRRRRSRCQTSMGTRFPSLTSAGRWSSSTSGRARVPPRRTPLPWLEKL